MLTTDYTHLSGGVVDGTTYVYACPPRLVGVGWGAVGCGSGVVVVWVVTDLYLMLLLLLLVLLLLLLGLRLLCVRCSSSLMKRKECGNGCGNDRK